MEIYNTHSTKKRKQVAKFHFISTIRWELKEGPDLKKWSNILWSDKWNLSYVMGKAGKGISGGNATEISTIYE